MNVGAEMKTSDAASLNLIFVTLFIQWADSFIIAPPWVNPTVNPCSKESWQLILWPSDKKCYQIFEQGPCPHSQELAFNAVTSVAECRCPKNLLFWAATNRCYPEYSRGPCEVNQYLERSDSGEVSCRDTKICENGWIFWPPEKECYQLYTQGPCHKGDLLIMNPLTVEPYCGCDPLLLNQYYFPQLKLCYEHYTRGPCETGLLFAYNHSSQMTHCMCQEDIGNYHTHSQQCFQFGQKGPCQKGQVFEFRKSIGRGECRCREGYVLWPENGECYKSYTSGPCRPGEIIFPVEDENGEGICVRNPCSRAHLFFPDNETDLGGKFSQIGIKGSCHKVGSRGPCDLGQLVVFEKYSGKSFRGECGCSPGYNQNFWPENGQCYEWYTRGPCPEKFLFQYNKETGGTECACDDQEGYVFWNETQDCYKVFSQGPCPDNAILIPTPDLSEVFCECKSGYVYSPSRYACEPGQVNKPRRSLGYSSQPETSLWSQDIENNGNLPKLLDLFQGIFVNPNEDKISERRQDGVDIDREEDRSKWPWWRRGRHLRRRPYRH